MLMGVLGWLFCGALLGFIASKFVNLRGDDPRLGIGTAALGGVVGGWLYSLISGSPVSGFNVWSLVFASLISLVAVGSWHFFRSRGPYERPSTRRSY